jgi:hypothetical protein
MNQSANSVQNGEIVSDAAIREVLRRQLHRAIHIDRHFTRQSLADESGVSIHQIDQILSATEEKHRRVALADALSLCVVLGQRAVNALLAKIGYVAQPLDEPEQANLRMLVADGLRHFSVIAGAAADGIIDHTEKPLTMQAADGLIATVLPLSSAGKAI